MIRRESTYLWTLAWALVFSTAVAAGCSTDEPLPRNDRAGQPDADHRRVGSLLAEFDQSAPGGASRVQVHAQFLDARGVRTGRALEALEVWNSDARLDRDACTMQTDRRTTAQGDDLRLDLLGVGPITVDGPGRRLQLKARRLPDLVSAFSGVIYGTDLSVEQDGGDLVAYEPGARYRFQAPGGQSTGGFDVKLEAPEPIDLLATTGRYDRDNRQARLTRGRAFAIRWNTPIEARGEVFLDVVAGHGPDAPRLKCRLEDDGAFELPADILGQLAASDDTLDVSLRRVSSRQVDIAGLDTSEFTLSAVDRLRLRLE